uniref:Ubiquinol-cytochrome c reductase iron-sulphur subunit N-terminal domain-containing protein n=1 Tax=Sinocyclocheilus grahami TaxID=75366 RepID=A0A672L9P5_SINGR
TLRGGARLTKRNLYLQATNSAMAGPLKPLIPGVVMKTNKLLKGSYDAKPFLCREYLSGQSAKSGHAVSISLNGESHCGVEGTRESRSLHRGRRPYSGAPQGHYEFSYV